MLIECFQGFVLGGSDKNKPSCSDDWTTVIFGARWARPSSRQIGKVPESYLPGNPAVLEVNGIESPPWGSDGRITL